MDDNKISNLTGKQTLTIVEAMQKIDRNTCGILFLVDDEEKLTGCITDGDIRRFLLSGGNMSAPALDAANKHPKVAKNETEAKALFHKKNFIIIPIVDEENKVIAFYGGEGRELRKRNALNIPVVINAGGKGTRLDPFTRVLPKPLIPVGDLSSFVFAPLL